MACHHANHGGEYTGRNERHQYARGIYLLEKPLPQSERFVLSVKAPDASMQVMAQVVWSNNYGPAKKDESPGMGVRFIWS
jgi:hypothetical protein